jgi:acyl-CoA reductase-like NAD-dependent aldehyde dehydrogenase
VRATVFADVESGMWLAQYEVFGPVLAILRFQDEADAVRMANDTRYGLASGIWTSDIARAHRVGQQLRVELPLNRCQSPISTTKDS